MSEQIGQWADIFPYMRSIATDDPRIFATHWKKSSLNTKTKTFFCCIVGGTCFGVDVIRPWATKADGECKEAFAKVQRAADFFQEHGEWPKD